ncbi:MAG: hypothetical protein SOX72_01280 [Oscillospiraceae bacterium]|nr:hypothetical protein [Oscillospiraceae bacterium]
MRAFKAPRRGAVLVRQVAVSAILFGAVLFAAFWAVGSVEDRNSREQEAILRDAVRRAAVQCYAIEGAYPSRVGYLEEHYGLTVNHEKYEIFYSTFGSNIMPDIEVFRKGGAAE